MVGEAQNELRIFSEEGRLLCWLNLEHPLPLKWDLRVTLFSFWEDVLVDAIKLVSHLNFRIKHKKSRFRRRIKIKSILQALEQKYLDTVLRSASDSSRQSESLSYISSGVTPSNANYIQRGPDTNLLFSLLPPGRPSRNSFRLKRLTLDAEDAEHKPGNPDKPSNKPKADKSLEPKTDAKPRPKSVVSRDTAGLGTSRHQKQDDRNSGVYVMKDEYSIKDILFDKYRGVIQKQVSSRLTRSRPQENPK